jgi:hypothetical protein
MRNLVRVVDVVTVHQVLHYHVKQAEGGDEGTDDTVGRSESEDEEHPAVVEAVGVFVQCGLSNRERLCGAASRTHSECIHWKQWTKLISSN